MRKLKLKLDDLSVTPFVTGEARTLRGTVDGYEETHRSDCTGAVTAAGALNNCYPIDPTTGPVAPEETYDYYCTLGNSC